MSDIGTRHVGMGGVCRTSVGRLARFMVGHWLHSACSCVSAYVGELFSAGYLQVLKYELNLIGIEYDVFIMDLCMQSVASFHGQRSLRPVNRHSDCGGAGHRAMAGGRHAAVPPAE